MCEDTKAGRDLQWQTFKRLITSMLVRVGECRKKDSDMTRHWYLFTGVYVCVVLGIEHRTSLFLDTPTHKWF
jgi:hypothetical protein